MNYRFAPCRPNPSVPGRLAYLSNVQILGVVTIDDVEFVIINTNELSTIALDLSSGFYYPFKHRWKFLQRNLQVVKEAVFCGTDVGQIVISSFVLGRDEGQKRLRTALDIPTDYKVLLLSGGGIRLKDSTGKKIPTFTLLEGKTIEVDYEVITRMSNSYSAHEYVLHGQGSEYLLARRFIEEENQSQGLFEIILQSADNDDEGSVSSQRDEANSRAIEREMRHHFELVR